MGSSRSRSIDERRKLARRGNNADYAAKRAEILRVATEVFRAKGYAASTLQDVAGALGWDRGTLYYYVASKDDLFQQCIHEAVTNNIRDAEIVAASGGTPTEKLRDFLALLIRSQETYYPTVFVYQQEDMARLSSIEAEWATTMVAATHRFEAFFLEALDEGIRDGTFRSDLSPTLVANAVFGMALWTHRWWVPGVRYSADDLIRVFTKVLFGGVEQPDESDGGADPRISSAGRQGS